MKSSPDHTNNPIDELESIIREAFRSIYGREMNVYEDHYLNQFLNQVENEEKK